ncbi:MAG: endonuclease/exonuclease/phosphatase family protein [Spartobacteria bacterium]
MRHALLAIFVSIQLLASPAGAREFSLMSYNVENLFDIDGTANYGEYVPAEYTPAHLLTKVKNIALVLSKAAPPDGPDIIVFNEIEIDHSPDSKVENLDAWLKSMRGRSLDSLLKQKPIPPEIAGLPAEAWLLKACEEAGLKGYHVASAAEKPGEYEGGRPRTVRNLIFSRFPILAAKSHQTLDARDILEVRLDVDGQPLTVFANHWKSGASDSRCEAVRIANAATLRTRIDALLRKDPQADIVLAGDFNSHYNQNQRYPELKKTGILDVLRSQGNETALPAGKRDLYNLWFELPPRERGSDIYRQEWGTLMHLILTPGLYDNKGLQYVDNSFRIVRVPSLNTDIFGRPQRWFRGARPGGFSDHFPILAKFRTADPKDKDAWMALKNPSTTPTGPGEPVLLVSSAELFKDAIDPSKEPDSINFRDGSFDGRVFLIHAPASVDKNGKISVKVNGLDYDVYAHDKKVLKRLRKLAESTQELNFYGALGTYKGRWQFVLHGKEWIATKPSSIHRKASPFGHFAQL